jgi:uncharacterized phosphosugar-binding protein
MKRREAFHMIPLSAAGLALMANRIFAQDGFENQQGMAPPNPWMQPLSIRYLNKVKDMLTNIRETQSDKLLEASYAIARTVMKKNTCWYSWDMGHSLIADLVPGRNGVPEIFTVGYDAGKSKKGDLFLANIFEGPHADLEKKDIFVIGSPVPWSSDAKGAELIVRDSAKVRIRPYSKIWIETNLTTVGAIMKVPGMPAPVGPVSGIIGMVTFWMMMADTCRILSRDGQSVPVRGDEPKLAGKDVPWVNLSEPLMDAYFETLMRELEMIGMEMGNIRQIARMAVDSVLAGGKVWCYSRYFDSLCIEAQTRRGGLGMTHGVYEDKDNVVSLEGDFKGSSKDLVIMGIYQPEDEHDLKNLDFFRKSGMKVASIGPITRDIKIPDGRTVPKETDVHVGRMSDTYGLFAVPGFERKVCPTTGALQNQIFWATCMEMVEEMIRRTGGNIPGVFFSAAIKGGTEHMIRMQTISKERGY